MDFFNKKLFYHRTSKQMKVELNNEKNILIVGLGGLGSYLAEFLARSGFNLILVDFDSVEITNLGRQNYTLYDVEHKKTAAMRKRIESINPTVNMYCYNSDIIKEKKKLYRLISRCDMVASCVDILDVKKEIAEKAYHMGKPLVNGSAIGKSGEIFFQNPSKIKAPCYNCIYGSFSDTRDDVASIGVAPYVPSAVAMFMASIIVEFISNRKRFDSKIFRLDMKNLKFNDISVNKNKKCSVCYEKESI